MNHKYPLISFAMSAWLAACGGAGVRPSTKLRRPPPPAEEEQKPEKEKPTATDVGLALLGGNLQRPKRCEQSLTAVPIADLSETFVMDGVDREWRGEPLLTDRTSDSRGNLDLNYVFAGAQKQGLRDDFVGLVKFAAPDLSRQLADHAAVYLEFGAARPSGDDLAFAARRLFRIDHQGMAELRNGLWDVFAQDGGVSTKGGYKVGADSLEWAIDWRQLDDVRSQPAWWLRVYTEENDLPADSTGAHYLFGDSQDDFSTTFCAGYADAANLPLRFQQVRASDLAENVANLAFDIVRHAYQDVQKAFGLEDLPFAALTVFATARSHSFETTLVRHWSNATAIHLGLVLQIDPITALAIENGRYETLYLRIANTLIDTVLERQFTAAAEYLRHSTREALINHLELAKLGQNRWLERYRSAILDFIAAKDSVEPLSLATRMRLLAETPDPAAYESLMRTTNGKIKALGDIFASTLSKDEILATWRQAGELSGADTEARFIAALRTVAGDQVDITALLSGWLRDTAYTADFSPDQLDDADSDGIPNFFETDLGLDANLADTDNDGWTDFAELVRETEPRNSASNPNAIVADGSFGDWEELLPADIRKNPSTASPVCPRTSFISSMIALTEKSKLAIAAYGDEAWTSAGTAIGWEAQIDLRKIKRKFLVRAVSGSYRYTITDVRENRVIAVIESPMPQAIQAAEWIIDFANLGVSVDIRKPSDVAIKITTILESTERLLCDSTPWFAPLIKE